MRYYDNGCMFTVRCSERDVDDFAAKWPCFGPRRALAFMFNKSNGDLVEMDGNTNGMDEYGVSILSQDAQAWGTKQHRPE